MLSGYPEEHGRLRGVDDLVKPTILIVVRFHTGLHRGFSLFLVHWTLVPNFIVVDPAEPPPNCPASGVHVTCRVGVPVPPLLAVLANLALCVQRRVTTEQLIHCSNPR